MSRTFDQLVKAGSVLLLVAVVCQAVSQDSRGPVVFASSCKHQGDQHNFTLGQKSSMDRLLYTEQVSLPSKLWRINRVERQYPLQGDRVLGTISYIEAVDLRKDATGGCVFVRNGGTGQTRVTLHFETMRNHGLDFSVSIYGH